MDHFGSLAHQELRRKSTLSAAAYHQSAEAAYSEWSTKEAGFLQRETQAHAQPSQVSVQKFDATAMGWVTIAPGDERNEARKAIMRKKGEHLLSAQFRLAYTTELPSTTAGFKLIAYTNSQLYLKDLETGRIFDMLICKGMNHVTTAHGNNDDAFFEKDVYHFIVELNNSMNRAGYSRICTHMYEKDALACALCMSLMNPQGMVETFLVAGRSIL